jgi:hypothetical protein
VRIPGRRNLRSAKLVIVPRIKEVVKEVVKDAVKDVASKLKSKPRKPPPKPPKVEEEYFEWDEKMSRDELRAIAKKLGVKDAENMLKDDVIKKLERLS